MRSFTNVNPRTLDAAVAELKKPNAAIAGGGTDMLGMMKEHLATPDVLVHLRAIKGLDQVTQGRQRSQNRRPDDAR